MLDEESGRDVKVPEECSGLRAVLLLKIDGLESPPGPCDATDPELCKGLRGTLVLTEGLESDPACCEGTDPDVCRGLRIESCEGFEG